MKFASCLIAAWLLCNCVLLAQSSPSSTEGKAPPAANSSKTDTAPTNPPNTQGPIDVLTDTKGFNISPYLQGVVATVRQHWYAVVPESARPPERKKGQVLIRFHILKDGSVTEMRTVGSSGDAVLDQAAYSGISSSSPFKRLPKEFACDYVSLQFRFYYNPTADDIKGSPGAHEFFPCVTSSVHMIGELGIRVLPAAAELVAGGKQQFSAMVTGTENLKVSWSVKGPGCEASDCGSISDDGLYTAPSIIPDPPKVTVTGILSSSTNESDSATITLVQPKPR